MATIGLVTSGGDAPGMNAAIRAVVRVAYSQNLKILGFVKGWQGVINDKYLDLTPRSVGGIIQLGGTILQTARCPEFKTELGIEKAARTLNRNDVEGLIVIGGEGSFRGALELSSETDIQLVGIPATIDNDVFGTDETIGFDTAVNTAVTEIDKIRDTAISHERIFIVEVMGRIRGFLASTVGLTVGAEIILVPEIACEIKKILRLIKQSSAKGKRSGIIVTAEGVCNTHRLAKQIQEETGSEVRISVLGYAQRGGSPTARSRLLASLFGEKAVHLLLEDDGNQIVGLQDGRIGNIRLDESCRKEKSLNLKLIKLAEVLAT